MHSHTNARIFANDALFQEQTPLVSFRFISKFCAFGQNPTVTFQIFIEINFLERSTCLNFVEETRSIFVVISSETHLDFAKHRKENVSPSGQKLVPWISFPQADGCTFGTVPKQRKVGPNRQVWKARGTNQVAKGNQMDLQKSSTSNKTHGVRIFWIFFLSWPTIVPCCTNLVALHGQWIWDPEGLLSALFFSEPQSSFTPFPYCWVLVEETGHQCLSWVLFFFFVLRNWVSLSHFPKYQDTCIPVHAKSTIQYETHSSSRTFATTWEQTWDIWIKNNASSFWITHTHAQ